MRHLLFTASVLAGVLTVSGCHSSVGASGIVLDEAGEPVSDAAVELYGWGYPDSKVADSFLTGIDGRFHVKYRVRCGFMDCLLGGTLIVDADGYESRLQGTRLDQDDGFEENAVVSLVTYDELSVEASGIPDEQPREYVESTRRSDYVPELPVEGGPSYNASTIVYGTCSGLIRRHGRTDEYACESASLENLGSCFLPVGSTDVLVCRPEGYGSRSRVIFKSMSDLPSHSDEDPVADPLPFTVYFPGAASDYRSVRCTEVSQPLFTNVGEEIGYECSGQPMTWLLNSFSRDGVWTVDRVGGAHNEATGSVDVLGRRRVYIESVRF